MPASAKLLHRRFGRLKVVAQFSSRSRFGSIRWVCRCDCGKTITNRTTNDLLVAARHDRRQSCGCWKDELTATRAREKATHGLTRNGSPSKRLYNNWWRMLARCDDSEDKAYRDYGGRGIKVCKAWRDPKKFVKWAWNSGYQFGLTIERINVNGDYRPGNCTWIPKGLQSTNMRKVILYSFGQYTLCLSGWGRRLGISPATLTSRRQAGWPIAKILTTPVKRMRGYSEYKWRRARLRILRNKQQSDRGART